MIPDQPETPVPGSGGADKFDDDQYPAYTMGRAADMLGVTQGFLRSLDAACRIITLEDQLHDSERRNTELRSADADLPVTD
ncbi:MAG: MerR family transcriptional regulator [Amycolatopsis sp.]|jgi:hypothetical protein|uniref:hypothetical protein n=1 Tax=Amycolatopsis sp. TaxID=37632 RepID=UPI00261C5CD6|nr:hypothetical protein [Amycolatopsis sp.]MCU1680539.1 MerR family transcriptional regulator [Amycolatopsis sp.]